MEGAKSPLQSLTVVSAAASALLSLLGAGGITLDPALVGQAVSGGAQCVSAALALVAVYGRIRASVRIAPRN